MNTDNLSEVLKHIPSPPTPWPGAIAGFIALLPDRRHEKGASALARLTRATSASKRRFFIRHKKKS